MRINNQRVKMAGQMLTLGLCLTLFGTNALADLAVVTNPSSGVTALSADDVKALFLGKSHKFPNGTSAVPVDQAESSPARAIINDKVLGKSDSQMKAYWSQLIFSGKGTPPKSVDSDAAVKAFVAQTPGGIGYIDSSAADGSVTVVLTVK